MLFTIDKNQIKALKMQAALNRLLPDVNTEKFLNDTVSLWHNHGGIIEAIDHESCESMIVDKVQILKGRWVVEDIKNSQAKIRVLDALNSIKL